MKYILTSLFLFLSTSVFSQKIDYKNFDKSLFEKILFELMNEKRKMKGIDTLAFSTQLYKEASVRNINIILETKIFEHPDFTHIWDSLRVRRLIAEESDFVLGGEIYYSPCCGHVMDYHEILFKSEFYYETYHQLAQTTINTWEKSRQHRYIQSLKYSDMGKPGLASCAVGIDKTDKLVYVVFNFVYPYRKGRDSVSFRKR